MPREMQQLRSHSHQTLEFRKTIYVSAWDEATKNRAISYWEKRGFRFSPPRDNEQVGRRGSLWGNWSECDMSKLIASLTITHMGENEITFTMEVDTYFQIMTPWRKVFWDFEMARSSDFVLYGDKREQDWREFEKNWRKAWRKESNLAPYWVKMPELPDVN